MKPLVLLLLAGFAASAVAADPASTLPPAEIVARVLRDAPDVQAATSQIRAEEANRRRLEAGPHEWNLRLGGQQRRSAPATGPNERFSEWNSAIERPLRLPGKAATDAELGAAGVTLAETAYGDALHEASRSLLKAWFVWLRETAASAQWTAQVELLDRQAKAIERRRQLGDAARLDAIQAEAALAQAVAQRTQAEARRRSAGEDLRRRYPGLPLNEPATLDEPQPLAGSDTEWIAALLEHSHELGLARGEAQRARIAAERQRQDRMPDPSVGLQFSRERGGEENVVGAYISIPLPGDARRATADASLAQAEAAGRRAEAVERRIGAEAATLLQAVQSATPAWQAARDAAERLERSADLTARAYQLGEGSLNELLTARRLANEARLAARTSQLDALELRYRLLLDAHRLWDLD
ncbi:MAG: TolC family protein [Dechloromonas sp.]|nr:TolC family protein [Dechloromonas sp.]